MQTIYKPLVLVVDDNETVARTLALLLQQSGYNAVSAGNGSDALDVASGIAVDVAICDIQLPGIDGLQTAVELCKRLPNCKIILISGQPESTELFERAVEQGLHFPVLAKPVPPAELLGLIQELLRPMPIDIRRGKEPPSLKPIVS